MAARTPITALPADSSGIVVPGEFTWTAADVTNGNATPSTGKEIILAWNTDGVSTHTMTVYNSNGNSFTKDIAAGKFYRVGSPIAQTGWRQDTDGAIWFNGSNAALKFCVIRIP